jgi:hypothetical protein
VPCTGLYGGRVSFPQCHITMNSLQDENSFPLMVIGSEIEQLRFASDAHTLLINCQLLIQATRD